MLVQLSPAVQRQLGESGASQRYCTLVQCDQGVVVLFARCTFFRVRSDVERRLIKLRLNHDSRSRDVYYLPSCGGLGAAQNLLTFADYSDAHCSYDI